MLKKIIREERVYTTTHNKRFWREDNQWNKINFIEMLRPFWKYLGRLKSQWRIFLEISIFFPKLTSLKTENFNSWIFLGDTKKVIKKLPLGKAKGQNGIGK